MAFVFPIITLDLTPVIKDFCIAAAGAIGGAYGAQIIAEKSKAREELLQEIRNTNASLSVAFSICNSMLSLKDQHIKRMKENYDLQRATVLSSIRLRQRGIHVQEFRFLADLQVLSLPYQPIDVLQKQLFEKLSVRGRPLNLVTALAQSLESMHQACEKRNELVKSYQTRKLSQNDFYILFFGFPYDGGHINNEYPATLDIMFSVTNDCAFFSNLLSKDLVKHGKRLVRRFERKFGKGAPPIHRADFSKAINSGLMPENKDYTDWLTMFLVKPRPPKSFYERTVNKWYFWNKHGLYKS